MWEGNPGAKKFLDREIQECVVPVQHPLFASELLSFSMILAVSW